MIRLIRKLQKPRMQKVVWTAALREGNAEDSQNSSHSSHSLVHFGGWLLAKTNAVVSIKNGGGDGGSRQRLKPLPE